MGTTIQVRQRGMLTLPAELRSKYNIETGATFYLVDLDGVLVLSPMTPMLSELAREIERLRLEAGVSVEEFLLELREQRQKYYHEKYDPDGESA